MIIISGVRLIVNAKYFHVAGNSEKASTYAFTAEAAANLVNYIATRESVIHNFTPEYEMAPASAAQMHTIEQFRESASDIVHSREYQAYQEHKTAANATRLITRAAQYTFGVDQKGNMQPTKPATRAQRDRIREFVQRVPAIRKTPEYMDYRETMSREAASEVLSHALEVAMESAADPETLQIMLNYISERPGVVRNENSDHGLFCSAGAADLDAEKDAIAAHKGNIYSMVFSLRREDADQLGYDRQENWKELFIAKQAEIAKAMHMPVSELHWIAAVHNTTYHPHAHFICYSTNLKTRMYLSQTSIEEIKSSFVSDIFKDERYAIYAPREEIRTQLIERTDQLLRNLSENGSEELEKLHIAEKLSELKTAVLSSKGRHVYKYLPKEVKGMVDRLLDDISAIPQIKELLDEYNTYQQQLEVYYKEKPDEPTPLSQVTSRHNLYPIKNLVVTCALESETPEQTHIVEETGTSSGFSFDPVEKKLPQIAPQVPSNHSPEDLRAAAMDGTADDKFRYAQYLHYQSDEPEEALMWYNLAEQDGHAEAAYQLAQFYLRDPDERNIPLANEYLLTAKLRFEDQLRFADDFAEDGKARDIFDQIEAGIPYSEARNLGFIEPPNKQELRMIGKAAHILGRIHITGIELSELDFVDTKNIAALQVSVDCPKAAAYLEFAYDCGRQNAAYQLGKLYFRGDLSENNEPDFEHAAEWYEKGAKFDLYSRFALAGVKLHGQGTERNTAAAEALYRDCLTGNRQIKADAAYTLAELQNTGTIPKTDMDAMYRTAFEIWASENKPDAYIYQRMARMLEYGLGVEQDLEKAIFCYRHSEKTPENQYKIAQLLQRTNGEPEEIQRLYKSAFTGMIQEENEKQDPDNAQRAVRIATMKRYGLGVGIDLDVARFWYSAAAERGSKYAEQQLHMMNEPKAQEQTSSKAFSAASKLLDIIGRTLRDQTLRDQQPNRHTDRQQLRQERRKRRALGHKSDFEQSIK